MGALSSKARDHRRRVLEHQEKLRARDHAPQSEPADPQLKIPLIGEVKRDEGVVARKRKLARTRKPDQPKLGDL